MRTPIASPSSSSTTPEEEGLKGSVGTRLVIAIAEDGGPFDASIPATS